MVGKEFPASPSHLKRKCSQQERREELQGRATVPRFPQMSQSIPEEPVFPALPRLSRRGSTHTTVARGIALCERLVGKPHGKASREIHRSQYQHEEKPDTATTAQKEKDLGCSHLKRGLTTLWRLQKCHKMHVNTGSESSGPELDPIRGLRPWHDRRVIPRGPLELARRLNFPEAIRARPWRPRHNSRAPAPTRENSGGSTLQAT